MKALIITTLQHNIGDDFVREGILNLLEQTNVFDSYDFVHKHAPVSAVYGLGGIRSTRISNYLEPLTRKIVSKDRISAADVVFQSGAPIYWCHPAGPHCADNEWFDPLIRQRFLKNRRARKLVNLAGGSCQTYHSDGNEIATCLKCFKYIREFFDVSDLTTLRDKLARSMLKRVGREAELLPCTSIFARDRFDLRPSTGEFIVLNFMENAGHYTFGQKLDSQAWRDQFQKIACEAGKHGRVVVACHTPGEEKLARILVPDLERFLVPNDHLQFMRFYSRARFGIVNRVHAAFMMASFGKPAVVIGNDSRALMIDNLNLRSIFVNDVSKIGAETIVETVASNKNYSEEIEEIRSRAKGSYLTAIRQALDV